MLQAASACLIPPSLVGFSYRAYGWSSCLALVLLDFKFCVDGVFILAALWCARRGGAC